MRPSISTNYVWILKAAFLFSIIAFSFFIAQSSQVIGEPYIFTAITFDLLITLPLAYLFFIRKTAIPKITALPVFFLSAIFASFILPANDRYFFELAVFYAVPAIEIGALLFVGVKIYKARQSYLASALKENDVIERLRKVLVAEMNVPFVARAAAFELGTIWLAVFAWKRKSSNETFTYHKRSGVLPVLTVLIGMLVVETVIVHYLVGLWNQTFAWILTALSIYLVLQLFAHAKAIVLRPIAIQNGKMFLRCGLVGDAEIALDNVKSVGHITSVQEAEDGLITASVFGDMIQPNICITLEEPAVLNSFYGVRKSFEKIQFTVDEPEDLVLALNGKRE